MKRTMDNDDAIARRNLLTMAVMAPVLAMGLASAAESTPTAAADLPPDLAQAVSAYDHATVRNDIAALGELVAEDYMLVNSDSTLQDKQSYLADFTVPGFRLDPYVLEQAVYKVWGDTALIGALLRLSWTLDGAHESRLLRIAHVWAKHDGRWRLAYTQLTRVPQ